MTEEVEGNIEQTKSSSGISRRKFIKGTVGGVVLGAAAGGALLSGLPSTVNAVRGPTLPSNEHGVDSVYQPVGPIPSTWDKTVDVLVVGSGGAGMCAAIEATVAGANTLIIEKMDHYGGLFMGAGGDCTIGGNNHVQQNFKVTGDSLQHWYNDEMRCADYRGYPELYHTYVELGDSWLAWMESLGAVWGAPTVGTAAGGQASTTAATLPTITYTPTPGAATTTTTLVPESIPLRGLAFASSSNYPTTNGFSWIYLFAKRLAALNVPIQLNTAMTGIYRVSGGPVVGVAAVTPTGAINIKANKGVVVATGGCADNLRMCYSYDPRYNGDTYHDGAGPIGTPDMVQNTGDGQLALQAVGGGLTDMSYVIYLPIKWGSHLYWVWPTQNPRNYLSDVNAAGVIATSTGVSISDPSQIICVKGDGTRFVNETCMNQIIPTVLGIDPYAPLPYGGIQNPGESSEWPEHQFLRAWLNLPDRPRNCWAVTDAPGASALNWPTATITNPNPTVSPALYPDSCATSVTIAGLAQAMGVSPSGLATTVANYNGYVVAGKDPDFGSTPKHQISTSPFYAVKWNCIRHTQRNGIRVNSSMQVIDQLASQWNADQEDENEIISINQEPVIPHLYAAGEDAGNLGWRRVHSTCGVYSIFGRIAGQKAAAEPSMA